MISKNLGRIFWLLATVALVFGSFALISPAYAGPDAVGQPPNGEKQEVCPDGDGWTKENVNAQSVTLYADSGKLIDEICYKAGNEVVHLEIDPAQESVLVESEVWNKPECPGVNGCNYVDISHASKHQIDAPAPEYSAELQITNVCRGIKVEAVIYEDGEPINTVVLETYAWQHENIRETFGPETYEVTLPDDSKVNLQLAKQYEPEECQKEQAYVWYDSSCSEFWGGYAVNGGDRTETFRGNWQDPNGPESVTMEVQIPEGETLEVTVVKSVSCIQCEVTPVYPMASYIVKDAPDTYWQGPFDMGPGVCNVIHQEGQTPSAERVATVCSLCEDQIDGGFVYDVREGNGRQFYDGWVYKVDCYGQEAYYTYAGHRWDDFVRSGYSNTGERLCNREEGCADWIHDNYEADPE